MEAGATAARFKQSAAESSWLVRSEPVREGSVRFGGRQLRDPTTGHADVLLHHCFGEVNGRRGLGTATADGAVSDAIAARRANAGRDRSRCAVAQVIVNDGKPLAWCWRTSRGRGSCVIGNLNKTVVSEMWRASTAPNFGEHARWEVASAVFGDMSSTAAALHCSPSGFDPRRAHPRPSLDYRTRVSSMRASTASRSRRARMGIPRRSRSLAPQGSTCDRFCTFSPERTGRPREAIEPLSRDRSHAPVSGQASSALRRSLLTGTRISRSQRHLSTASFAHSCGRRVRCSQAITARHWRAVPVRWGGIRRRRYRRARSNCARDGGEGIRGDAAFMVGERRHQTVPGAWRLHIAPFGASNGVLMLCP